MSYRERIYRKGNSMYHRLRMSWLFWYYVLNRRSRRAWKMHQREFTPVEQCVVDELRKNGVAVVHITELFSDTSFLERLKTFTRAELARPENQAQFAEHADELIQRTTQRHLTNLKAKNKDFRVNLWGLGERGSLFDPTNPFFQLCLSETILSIVGAYLKVAPTFAGGVLQSTLIVPAGSPEYLSQRWHRDPEDKKLMRVFLYVSDVDEPGAGPFRYCVATQFGGKWRQVYPQQPPVGRYPPPGAVEKIIPASDMRMFLGRAGTIVFADTSGLHKGGYSTTKPRITFAATYFSDAALQPIGYEKPGGTVVASLSELGRFALNQGR